MSRLTQAAFLLACFGVASAAPSSATEASGPASYVIERSVDNGETWATRGTVVVTGAAVNSAKTKFSPTVSHENTDGLSETERAKLLGADRLIFRVKKQQQQNDGDAKKVEASDDSEIARIITTPCSLVRGFEIKTTKEVELIESLNVIITKSADNSQNIVTGLQFVPRTNLHHSSSKLYGNKAEACDKDVLSLFPKLTVGTTVGVARTTVPKRTPKYEESLYASQAAGDAAAAAQQQQQQQQKDPNQKYNEEGKPVDAEGKVIPEPDNRSFFEKYWHYILMFVVWQLLQSFINPPKKEGGAAAAGAAGAAQAKK